MAKIKAVYCLILIFAILRKECSAVDDVEAGKGAIEKVLDGVKELKDNTILKNVVTAGKIIGNTAIAVASIVDLIKSIKGGPKDSKELAYMKEQFSIVNTKLDSLELQFTDIKNLIDWSTVKVTIGKYEKIIKAMDLTYQNYLYAPSEIAEIYGDIFTGSFERHYQDSAYKIFMSMSRDGVLSRNIISVAREYMKEDQAKIAHFVSYLLVIIQKGVAIEHAYYAIKGESEAQAALTADWAKRIESLKIVAAKFDKEIVAAWATQYKKDSHAFTVSNTQLTNQQMTTQLHKLLQTKFPWRKFFVFVYTYTKDNDKDRYYDNCNGWNSGNVGNKIVIVNSWTRKELQTRKSDPNVFLKNPLRSTGTWGQVAKLQFNRTPTNCNLYRFKGVFEEKSKPSYISPGPLYTLRLLVTRGFSPRKYYLQFIKV